MAHTHGCPLCRAVFRHLDPDCPEPALRRICTKCRATGAIDIIFCTNGRAILAADIRSSS